MTVINDVFIFDCATLGGLIQGVCTAACKIYGPPEGVNMIRQLTLY
jgi:hypothetical protein